MNAHDILRRPRLSDKTEYLRSERNAYVFEVHPSANKTEVAKAVESVFGVKVVKVNTLNRAGKKRRVGRSVGLTAAWKQAIVTLADGQSIEEA